jgi:alpha-L-arabinofuranosidase
MKNKSIKPIEKGLTSSSKWHKKRSHFKSTRQGMKIRKILLIAPMFVVLLARFGYATEYHVSVSGDNSGDGSAAKPFKTISAAALKAMPGDVITVHEGTYRERVNPPRGGESDEKRITYQAAPGEKVVVKGSEVIKDWTHMENDTWKVVIPNTFFGDFNPFNDVIHGDWFYNTVPEERILHTGAVYLNEHWLAEAINLDSVMKPQDTNALWFAQVDEQNTTIHAQFKDVDPNKEMVEINVRKTIFYPDQPYRNYITLQGFIMKDAATPWAPPTAEQIGLIGTHWSKGWIIENNTFSYSACVGITLGKHGDEYDNKGQSADGYNGTINRAFAKWKWNKDHIGSQIVRNNHISHCEQAGIVGSLGGIFSTITGNDIHDIHVRQFFKGAEQGGIKLHAAIDATISYNHVYRVGGRRAIWIDWMAQGTRISGNLCHDNGERDFLAEVTHGPVVVDNNIFLTTNNWFLVGGQGNAFVHNLFAGKIECINGGRIDGRLTPFYKAHSTEIYGLHYSPGGDDRYYNNLFLETSSLSRYDTINWPVWMDGNVFLGGARPSRHEVNPLCKPGFDSGVKLIEKKDGWYLRLNTNKEWASERKRKLVTTELLGEAMVARVPFENPDGTNITVDVDYFGNKRDLNNPFPGPFTISQDATEIRVWPRIDVGEM